MSDIFNDDLVTFKLRSGVKSLPFINRHSTAVNLMNRKHKRTNPCGFLVFTFIVFRHLL